MNKSVTEILDKISDKLLQAGFTPFEEFSAVDSLIHSDECLGIYSVKDCSVVAEALSHDTLTFGIELDYSIEIRLMGKACDYVDYEDFSEKCDRFFFNLINDEETLMKGIKIGKAFQSLPLKRIERDISFCVRVCLTEVTA